MNEGNKSSINYPNPDVLKALVMANDRNIYISIPGEMYWPIHARDAWELIVQHSLKEKEKANGPKD